MRGCRAHIHDRYQTGLFVIGDTQAPEFLKQRGFAVDIFRWFDRFETQLKQVIREAEMREGLRPTIPLQAAANLLMATAEGRISQYVRSGFTRSPTTDWPKQWEQLMSGFFREAISQPMPGQASNFSR